MEQEPVEKKQRKDVDEAKEEYVKEMTELSKTYLPGILKKIVDVERLIKMDIKNEELEQILELLKTAKSYLELDPNDKRVIDVSLLTSLISKVNDVFRKYTQKLKQINTTQEFENFTRQYSEELDGKTGLEMATFFCKVHVVDAIYNRKCCKENIRFFIVGRDLIRPMDDFYWELMQKRETPFQSTETGVFSRLCIYIDAFDKLCKEEFVELNQADAMISTLIFTTRETFHDVLKHSENFLIYLKQNRLRRDKYNSFDPYFIVNKIVDFDPSIVSSVYKFMQSLRKAKVITHKRYFLQFFISADDIATVREILDSKAPLEIYVMSNILEFVKSSEMMDVLLEWNDKTLQNPNLLTITKPHSENKQFLTRPKYIDKFLSHGAVFTSDEMKRVMGYRTFLEDLKSLLLTESGDVKPLTLNQIDMLSHKLKLDHGVEYAGDYYMKKTFQREDRNNELITLLALLGVIKNRGHFLNVFVKRGLAMREYLKLKEEQKNSPYEIPSYIDRNIREIILLFKKQQSLCANLENILDFDELVALYSIVSNRKIDDKFIEEVTKLTKIELCTRINAILSKQVRRETDIKQTVYTSSGPEMLVRAIKEKDMKKVVDLIENKHVDPNELHIIPLENGKLFKQAPLFVAFDKDLTIADYLLGKAGASLFKSNGQGTVLMNVVLVSRFVKKTPEVLDIILKYFSLKDPDIRREVELGGLLSVLLASTSVDVRVKSIKDFFQSNPDFDANAKILNYMNTFAGRTNPSSIDEINERDKVVPIKSYMFQNYSLNDLMFQKVSLRPQLAEPLPDAVRCFATVKAKTR